MLTVLILVALAAFALTVISAMGKCPLWIPVALLSVFALLEVLPLK